MANQVSYMLEIYEPGSERDVICSYSSDQAFPTISKGNNLIFPNLALKDELRVTKVSHIVWENENRASFKTMIFTERVEKGMSNGT